jgi:hypothetical protein
VLFSGQGQEKFELVEQKLTLALDRALRKC